MSEVLWVPIQTTTELHDSLAGTATKAQTIEAMARRLSFYGEWSDCPPEVREKIKKMSGR